MNFLKQHWKKFTALLIPAAFAAGLEVTPTQTISFQKNDKITDPVSFQIKFKEKTNKGDYSDAFYFTPDEYINLDQKTLDAEKQARVDNWLALINKPAPAPTKAELQQEKDSLQSQIDQIDLQITATK